MRKPDESLDEYVVKAAQEISSEPPRPVSLRLTGEVEVLKPIGRWEPPVKLVPGVIEPQFYPAPPTGLSWFHRSLAIGGGMALAGLVLVSAIVIGVSDRPASTDAAQDQPVGDDRETAINFSADERMLAAEEPLSSDIFSAKNDEMLNENSGGSRIRRRSSRFDLARAAFRTPRVVHARKHSRPDRSTLYTSQFSPSTLVIYIEGGEIKTRIEPWLTFAAKKPQTNMN